MVEIETWCQGEGRIGTRRDWILKDYANGQVIGRATRCIIDNFSIINFYEKQNTFSFQNQLCIKYMHELLSLSVFWIIYSLNCCFLEFY